MDNYIDIIKSKNKFPSKLKKEEGEILKKVFEFDKKVLNEQEEIRDIKYRYLKQIGSELYILIEEFMFKDGETDFNIVKSIGSNYYLYKK